MRILLTGGGTGGHLFPIIAITRELKKISDLELLFIGPDDFSKNLLEKEGIRVKTILAGKLRRYFSPEIILDFLKMPIGLFQAFWHIFIFMPDVTFGKGGYGSLPAVLISWLFRIPILLHESDTLPGLSNRFLSRFAKRIAISFSKTEEFFPSQKTALIGNPVRIELTRGSKEEAKRIFGLESNKPILLIIGGSQGAQAINEIILSVLPQLLEKYELIWQTGEINYNSVEEEIKQMSDLRPTNCRLFSFLNENQLKHALVVADLIISRAGAGNIFEIAVCGRPSILIPLPESASNHQKENAFEYAKKGATVVLEQANLTPNLFLGEISHLLNNPGLLQKMSDSARSFARPEAAQKIVEELIKLAR